MTTELRTALAAVATALTISCGPTTTTTTSSTKTDAPPPKVEERTVEVKPFEKEEIKPHYQAVILGSKPGGKSTIIPLSAGDKEVDVDAMWVRLGNGTMPTEGGSSKVRLTTAPQKDGRVRVGMYEQFAGGMGPQWRAAVWISSFVAATTLGKDLTDFRFTAENTGYIDGASAGALMTAGFLANLTGAEVDATASMTGIVNPDGTVGPVGGIPHKFEASIANGKKKVGFPVGQRQAYDLNKRRAVDLVELAKSKGAEAIEVEDVYQAYTLLTGKTLPVPIPVEVGEMALEEDVEAELAKHYKNWRQALTSEWTQLVELSNQGKLPRGLHALAERAAVQAREGEELMQKGLIPTAYLRVVEAVTYAATATAVYAVLERVRAGDLAGARSVLSSFQGTATETENALRKVGGMRPKTIGGHLQMVSAFQRAIEGWGFHTFGSEQMATAQRALMQLANKPKEQLATDSRLHEQVIGDITPAVLAIARGVAATRKALETHEVEGVRSHDYRCPLPNARRLAESFSSAASANIAYYEALFVKETANKYMVPEDRAQVILMRQHPDYLTAFMAFQLRRMPVGLPARLKKEWGEKSLPWHFGMLAGSILSYFKTSLLISKNYSLKVQVNPFTGEPTKVAHQRAFNVMMENAERKAREHAMTAKIATGGIPVQARLHYQNARTMRDSKNLSDRIRALELYWESSVYSQVTTMLARNG